jgi:chromate transporter
LTSTEAHGRSTLWELARLFLKLGTVAFGGPAAHIAMMEEEVVRRRAWLTRAEFLDYLGATNLIPGPNSTELAIHIGHARGGWRGLLVAGACFILPAALIVGVIAWAYVRFGQLPAIVAVFTDVKPVVIAIVLQALWALGRTAVKSRVLALVGLGALVAAGAGLNELLVLLGAGVATWVVGIGTRRLSRPGAAAAVALAPGVGVSTIAGATATAPLWILFATFVKIGAVLFGSGYVLLAFLRADFVQRLGWLTERQLLDAVAVGQVTPGPVFTTATFVGALIAGWRGAIVATVGIFLPAFVFVALSGPLVPRLRRSAAAGAVLDGVNVASLALMAIVTWQLARAAVVDVPTALLALISLILLLRFRVNSAWLVGGGALLGLLLPQ